MKYSAFLLLIFFCISCSSKKSPRQTVLTTNNLPAQLFEIEPAIENTIRTKNGATVRFPADAFKLNRAGKVIVEIKEAYSMKDILLAGLVTESNGRQLSSGGMIYINAQQNGKDVELQKTANVATPTPYVNPGMQLYKGEYNADSTINWVEPKPLDTLPQKSPDGKALFLTNCGSCHGIDKPSTGPELYNILKKAPSKEWLYSFTRNWENAFFHKDSTGLNYYAYTCCAVNYNPTQNMNKYPLLTDADLDALYGYIQYESDSKPIANYKDYSEKCKPCLNMPVMENIAPDYWDTTIVTETTQFYIRGNTEQLPETDKNQVPPTSLKYQFSVEDMGWYNIDILVEGMEGTIRGTLSVNNSSRYNNIDVYLAIPTKKIFSRYSGIKSDRWVFGFENNGDSLSLYPNTQAYIIAFGEMDQKMIYGIKPFITQKDNRLNMSLSPTTEKAFVGHLRKYGLDGLGISAIKTPDAEKTKTGTSGSMPQQPTPGTGNTRQRGNPDTATNRRYRYLDSDTISNGNCPCNAVPMPAANTIRSVVSEMPLTSTAPESAPRNKPPGVPE